MCCFVDGRGRRRPASDGWRPTPALCPPSDITLPPCLGAAAAHRVERGGGAQRAEPHAVRAPAGGCSHAGGRLLLLLLRWPAPLCPFRHARTAPVTTPLGLRPLLDAVQDLWGPSASEMLTVQYRMNSAIMSWSSEVSSTAVPWYRCWPACSCAACHATSSPPQPLAALASLPAPTCLLRRPAHLAGAVWRAPGSTRVGGGAHHGWRAWRGRGRRRGARAAAD